MGFLTKVSSMVLISGDSLEPLQQFCKHLKLLLLDVLSMVSVSCTEHLQMVLKVHKQSS